MTDQNLAQQRIGFGVSLSVTAALATKTLTDMGIVTEDDTSIIVCKTKI